MSKETTDLLKRAYAMEREAAERYRELARQMAAVNNRKAAGVFETLAAVEAKHAADIGEQLSRSGANLNTIPDYDWESPEGPETAAFEEAHYLMSEEHALHLALHNEQRAVDFFQNIAGRGLNKEATRLAEDFAQEEKLHVALVEKLLAVAAPTAADWHEDPDPAAEH